MLSLLGPATALADDEVTFDESDVIELPDGGPQDEGGIDLSLDLSLDLVTEDVAPVAVAGDKKPVYYTVSFDAQGGQPAPGAQTVEAGGFAVMPDAPTLDDHAFAGWFLDGADYFAAPTPINGDVTLTAGWEALPQEEVVEQPEEQPAEEEEIEIAGETGGRQAGRGRGRGGNLRGIRRTGKQRY